MKQYQIIRESNGVKEVFETSTRKREIEKRFNNLMRFFRKDKHFSVSSQNLGYSIVTYYGEFGHSFDTEYYITIA